MSHSEEEVLKKCLMEYILLVEQLQPSLKSACATQSGYSDVKRWRRVLWSDESYFPVWQAQSGFCQHVGQINQLSFVLKDFKI